MAIITKPHGDFVNNVDVANATYVDDQFNTLYNLVNGNLDSTNVKSAAAIANVTNPWGDNTFANRRHVSVQCLTNPALTGGVATKVPYANVVKDNQSEYNNTTYRYTAKTTGLVDIKMSIGVGGAAANSSLNLLLYVNGTESQQIQTGFTIAGGYFSISGSTSFYLNAGDYVELYVASSAGSTINPDSRTSYAAYTQLA